MTLGAWIRTRRGATVFAMVLVLVARAVINARWQFEAGLLESRTWMLLTIPFELLQHTEPFWLEAAILLGAAILFMSLTRNFSVRAILPLFIAVFAVDTLAMLAADAIYVVSVNRIIANESLATTPATWDLLLVDMTSVLMSNVPSIGIAAMGARVFSWLRPGMAGRAQLDSAG